MSISVLLLLGALFLNIAATIALWSELASTRGDLAEAEDELKITNKALHRSQLLEQAARTRLDTRNSRLRSQSDLITYLSGQVNERDQQIEDLKQQWENERVEWASLIFTGNPNSPSLEQELNKLSLKPEESVIVHDADCAAADWKGRECTCTPTLSKPDDFTPDTDEDPDTPIPFALAVFDGRGDQ